MNGKWLFLATTLFELIIFILFVFFLHKLLTLATH